LKTNVLTGRGSSYAADVEYFPAWKETLDAMGFVWNVVDYKFHQIVEALTVYKKLNGDLLVKGSFVIPSESPWPEDLRGLNLGRQVTTIRSQRSYVRNNPEREQLLNDMGFVWKIYRRNKHDTL
jgi:hypothetical protein